MKRMSFWTLSFCLALLLMAPAVVVGNAGLIPRLGPATEIAHEVVLIPLPEAQAQLDYTVPSPAWLPEGSVLLGAFFPLATSEQLYQGADARARAELQWQARVRPVGLAYSSPVGPFTVVRSSITVAINTPAGISAMPRGLDIATGERRNSDGFEYVLRAGVNGSLLPGHPSFPRIKFNTVTSRHVFPHRGDKEILDMLWRVSGQLPEETLVRIARSLS